MRVWRLTKTRYASSAFDGEGPRLYGGRWNSRGTRMTYASNNSALAVLEVLVHMTGSGAFPGYSLVTASLDDGLVEDLETSSLPRDWTVSPVPPEVQGVGDAWIRSGRSLALRVPSVLVSDSHNILINPAHPSVARLTVDSVEPFQFDPRLLR
jgi:RES domain-containing protein